MCGKLGLTVKFANQDFLLESFVKVGPAANTKLFCHLCFQQNVLPREQFPTAHVATSTNRRDYRGCSASNAVYRERLRDLSSIKTLHMHTSVVFGPGGRAASQFLSSAQEHYRNPADTAKEIKKMGRPL